MNKILKICLVLNFSLALILNVNAVEDENKIAVLVNDNIITNYDIEQRAKLYAILNQIQITSENNVIITN